MLPTGVSSALPRAASRPVGESPDSIRLVSTLRGGGASELLSVAVWLGTQQREQPTVFAIAANLSAHSERIRSERVHSVLTTNIVIC